MLSFLTVAALCASCLDEQQPVGPRLGVPRPTVDQQISDGCARFQVRFDTGGQPVVEPIYNTSACQTNQLKLLSDTAATFNAATGALRVALVIENTGTAAVIPSVKLRFNADSALRLDATGTPVSGTSDILGYQPDSSGASGRIAFWSYDQLLAASGQPQVLMPGARTQRRWIEFRGTGWTAQVRLKLFSTGAQPAGVPAIPPDSTPSFVSDSLQVVAFPGSRMRFVRDLLVVQFAASTSLGQKDSIVSSLSGTVVGGIRGAMEGGGFYYIRLPVDSTHGRLRSAETQLRGHPLVRSAIRYVLLDGSTSYLRPSDGVDWQAQDWHPESLGAAGSGPYRRNWGLRHARFPLAWGCSTGDSTVRVGVLDIGFRLLGSTMGDLAANVASSISSDLLGDTAVAHGSWVASVLGSRGNNGTGMVGAAWQPQLDLVDPTLLDVQSRPRYVRGKRQVPYAAIASSATAILGRGSRVLNVSLGARDTVIVDITDSIQVAIATTIAGIINLNATLSGADPLLVVSSGNVVGADPRGSLFPYLKDEDSTRTIVVAAIRRDGTLLGVPTGSRYIDVVAPGDSIGVLDPSGVVSRSGSSFATPHVSGLAALLFAFDPRLTASQARQLIIQGAVRGGRLAGGYPVLDAYEALKLAAERAGAPLCANHMWTDGTSLLVKRGSATEIIVAATPGPALWVNSFHGGKRAGLDFRYHAWQPSGQWSPVATLPPGLTPSGAFQSSIGLSHDGDAQVSPIVSGPGNGDYVIELQHTVNGVHAAQFAVASLLVPQNAPVYPAAAYPTIGDSALVAVSTGPAISGTPPVVIPLSAATVYRVSISGQQATPLWNESGRGVFFVGYSEDGSEIVAGVTAGYSNTSNSAIASCKVTWRKASTPSVVVDSAETPYACWRTIPIARGGGSSARIVGQGIGTARSAGQRVPRKAVLAP